jgi:glutamine---fructose-6-phosphate transaminase (isomerizing)
MTPISASPTTPIDLPSKMASESRAAAAQVGELLLHDEDLYRALGGYLRNRPPTAAVTIARGSSDHAAHYLAYLVMSRLGTMVASLPMSVVTLYNSPLRCEGLLGVALSQSGQSPDLVAPTRYLRNGGARTVAVVNDVQSPLALAAEFVLPLRAGPELSVAATKSFIAQLVVAARLVAHWQDEPALRQALERLPADLQAAAAADWSAALAPLREADRLFVLGRGPSLAVAQEMALKFKETCGISAEAFSGAEVEHGPMALVGEGFVALVLAPRGPAQAGMLALAHKLRERGARVLLAAPPGTPQAELPLLDTACELLDPIAAVQSFYPMVEALARARGLDPDAPRHLNKVTRTH